MWKRWALVSCIVVLAMTTAVLLSFENTGMSLRGVQRVELDELHTARVSTHREASGGVDMANNTVASVPSPSEVKETETTVPEVKEEKKTETMTVEAPSTEKERTEAETVTPESPSVDTKMKEASDVPSSMEIVNMTTATPAPTPVVTEVVPEASAVTENAVSSLGDVKSSGSGEDALPPAVPPGIPPGMPPGAQPVVAMVNDTFEVPESTSDTASPSPLAQSAAPTMNDNKETASGSPLVKSALPTTDNVKKTPAVQTHVEESPSPPKVTKKTTTKTVKAPVQLRPNTKTSRRGTGAFKGAGLRGFVQKRGMVPPAYFTAYTAGTRKEAFSHWMTAYLHGNLVSHAPIPYPHCQVYINHHYKFIWIKGHKVGSTSMRGPLGWLCDDRWRVPKGSNFSRCSQGLWHNASASVKEIKTWWKQYFVFGIVRNPYARFASAEEYIKKQVQPSCGRPTFEQTCREPYVHARLCKRRNCCWGGAVAHHYRHFMDQSTCLFNDMLLPAVDFIGETENLEQDVQSIIDEINRRRNPSLPALVNNLKKRNTHGRRLEATNSYADRLFRLHPKCLRSISLFYNKDFSLLDYEKLKEM